MTESEVYEDPFWSAYEHAIKALEYFKLLSDDELEYWFDFIKEEEYPTEDELNKFVDMCKNGVKSVKEDDNSCWVMGLANIIDNIEGYWPYA